LIVQWRVSKREQSVLLLWALAVAGWWLLAGWWLVAAGQLQHTPFRQK
jgi:hypothetical protein